MTFFLMSGIEGVIPHLVDGELSIHQYADDTILFMEHDLEKARNLKIDFCKSELFCFGDAQDEVNAYANLFECGQGSFLRGIWVFRSIMRDSHLRNGNLSRKDYKNV
jgi:hypothetical protein